VHPHLLYGIPVWGATNATNLKRLQTFQNKTLKIIGGGKKEQHHILSKLIFLKSKNL